MALLLVGDSVGDTPIENTHYDPNKIPGLSTVDTSSTAARRCWEMMISLW